MKSEIIVTTITILLLSTFLNSQAQNNYIVSGRDTIAGEITIPAKNIGNIDYIFFRDDSGKKRITAVQIKSFYRDNKFISVKYLERYYFMKCVDCSGYLYYLKYRPENSLDYPGAILMKKDGEILEVPLFGFKKKLSVFLSECAELSRDIENGRYSRSEVELITEKYNSCIAEKTEDLMIPPEYLQLISKIDNDPNLSPETKNDLTDNIKTVYEKSQSADPIPGYLIRSLMEMGEKSGYLKEIEGLLKNIK